MSHFENREAEIVALRQAIEQSYANDPAMLNWLRSNADALDSELRVLPSGTSPDVAIELLSTQQWFRDANPATALTGGERFRPEGLPPRESRAEGLPPRGNNGPSNQYCHDAAIRAGALEPQGAAERAAAGVLIQKGELWADQPKARARLEAWTQDCLEGRPIGQGEKSSAGCSVAVLLGGMFGVLAAIAKIV